MSANRPKGERGRIKKESQALQGRGEEGGLYLASNKDSEAQPLMYYSASLKGDTVDILSAGQDCFPL